MSSCKESISHVVFTNNPVKFKSLVHKYVAVETTGGEVYVGTLYTIDPVSESVVLIRKCDDILSMDIIMGHSVKSVQLKATNDQLPEDIFLNNEKQVTEEEIQLRKSRLKHWFLKNRTPVEEEGDILRIGNVVEIRPPYGSNQCLSSNEIILSRIQNLVSTMPENILDV